MSGADNVAEESMMNELRPKFRFMDLEIGQDALEFRNKLFDLADDLESCKLYPFANQLFDFRTVYVQLYLRRVRSNFKRDFIKFLIIARRSTIENAKVMLVLEKRRLISEPITTELLQRLDPLFRKITNF